MTIDPGILSADYKVVGGKLLRVSLSLVEKNTGLCIKTIRIYGDFFMHPEEALDDLEVALTGCSFEEGEIAQTVSAFFETEVEVIGALPRDFVTAIMMVSQS
jgi:lipoate-protein ligase A